MYPFYIVLFLSCLTSQTLIGYNSIPEAKLPTLAKTDPAFALTQTKVGGVFMSHCGIDLRGTISVAYQIVSGIKYNVVFDTKYGPINAIAITQYWQKSVDILDLRLLQPDKKNTSANTTSSSQPLVANVRSADSAKFQFPDLKAKCDLMKIQLEKLLGDEVDGLEAVSPLEQLIKQQKKIVLDLSAPPASAVKPSVALPTATPVTPTVAATEVKKTGDTTGMNLTNLGNSGITILTKSENKSSGSIKI